MVPSNKQQPVCGDIRPFASACSIMLNATRSLELPAKLKNSAFPNILQPVNLDKLFILIIGVFPTRLRESFGVFAVVVFGC